MAPVSARSSLGPTCAESSWPAAPAPGSTRSRTGVSKQLLPVYDKPMIYYPLSTLMLAGHPRHPGDHHPARRATQFERLLGDGSQFGINAHLRRSSPRRTGSPRRSSSAPTSSATSRRAGARRQHLLRRRASAAAARASSDVDGAAVFAYRVADPHGVRRRRVRRRPAGRCRSRRSRPQPRSNYAVPGLYFYDNDVVEIARDLKPSARGELRDHRRQPGLPRAGPAAASRCSTRGTAWLDTGTFDSLNDASNFVRDRRAPAGPQDRLPRGGRLAAGLPHRRRAAAARRGAGQDRLRRLPAAAARDSLTVPVGSGVAQDLLRAARPTPAPRRSPSSSVSSVRQPSSSRGLVDVGEGADGVAGPRRRLDDRHRRGRRPARTPRPARAR